MPEIFKAHAQYDDWSGTAAADDADNHSIREFIRKRAKLGSNSFVVGIRMFEQTSTRGRPSMRVVIADGHGHDDVNAQITASGILRFKEVDVELSYEEFFSLFKRFSIVLTSRDLGLEGREYEIIE